MRWAAGFYLCAIAAACLWGVTEDRAPGVAMAVMIVLSLVALLSVLLKKGGSDDP